MESRRRPEPRELGLGIRTIDDLRQLEATMPPLPARHRPVRGERRRATQWVVQLAWKTSDGRQRTVPALARNVTSTAVYLELEPAAHLSSPEPLLELQPGQELSLCALTRVIRVEAQPGKIGIALEIEGYRCAALPQTAEGCSRSEVF